MVARGRAWYQPLLRRRTDLRYPVVFEGHCVVRMIERNVDETDAERIVRKGSVVAAKSEEPDTLALRAPYRKRDRLVVVARFRPTHIKVVTVYVER